MTDSAQRPERDSQDPGPNALEVAHLSVRLAGREILHELSFEVSRGATLAVLGPNGAGETVLFRALVGAIPYTGRARWAPGTRIGYVPQKLDLERNLPVTGWDLLAARARIARRPQVVAEGVLTRVGLEPRVLDWPIGLFSGGQFQRLLMACALLAAPTVACAPRWRTRVVARHCGLAVVRVLTPNGSAPGCRLCASGPVPMPKHERSGECLVRHCRSLPIAFQ